MSIENMSQCIDHWQSMQDVDGEVGSVGQQFLAALVEVMIAQQHHKQHDKSQLQDHQPTLRASSRPSPLIRSPLLLSLLHSLFLPLAFPCHVEIPTHILQPFLLLPPHFLVDPMQPQITAQVLLRFIVHQQSNWQRIITLLQSIIFMQCEESTCRGGISCCNYDPSLGAYCVTDTYCNSVPPLWETIFIPVFLLAATMGILIVIYYKYRSLKPRLYTLADFVEREVRLQPMERNEQTKFKTIASFE